MTIADAGRQRVFVAARDLRVSVFAAPHHDRLAHQGRLASMHIKLAGEADRIPFVDHRVTDHWAIPLREICSAARRSASAALDAAIRWVGLLSSSTRTCISV